MRKSEKLNLTTWVKCKKLKTDSHNSGCQLSKNSSLLGIVNYPMMTCKNIKKVLMAGKKRSKFEYSQQNKENWDRGRGAGGSGEGGGEVYLEAFKFRKAWGKWSWKHY